MTKERKRLVTLFLLLGVLAVVLIYDWQSGDSAGGLANKSAVGSQANGKAAPQATNKKAVNGAPGQAGSEGTEGYRPLPLYALQEQGSASEEARRNIFVYYIPPPPPPPPPGPPPTLSLVSLSPDSVYARTGDFTLRVRGAQIPEDAQIFVNGQQQPTQFVNANELTTQVSKSRIAAQGKLVVEVKNARGDFSNQLAVNIIEPPTPSYNYVGRIDDLIFLRSGDDRYAVRVGHVVDEKKANRWRVISATDNNVIVQDVMIGVNHRLEMDLGQTASAGDQRQAPNTRVIRGRQFQPDEAEDEELQLQFEQEQLQQLQMQQQQLQMLQQQQLYQQQLQQRGQPGQPQQVWPQQQDPQQQQRLMEALELRQRLLQQQQQRNNRRPNRE